MPRDIGLWAPPAPPWGQWSPRSVATARHLSRWRSRYNRRFLFERLDLAFEDCSFVPVNRAYHPVLRIAAD
jgi:hypothetical protein